MIHDVVVRVIVRAAGWLVGQLLPSSRGKEEWTLRGWLEERENQPSNRA